MFQQLNAIPIADVFKVAVNGLGGPPIVLYAISQLKGRLPRYRQVRNAYSGRSEFSNSWFWSFLFSVLNFFVLVGIMLAILAVLILVTALPGGIDWLTKIFGSSFVQKL